MKIAYRGVGSRGPRHCAYLGTEAQFKPAESCRSSTLLTLRDKRENAKIIHSVVKIGIDIWEKYDYRYVY